MLLFLVPLWVSESCLPYFFNSICLHLCLDNVGFVQFCKDLNELAEDNESKFNEIGKAACSAVLNSLPLPAGQTPAETNCINGLAYLCRSCIQSVPHPEDKEIAVALNSATILSRTAIELFVGVYKESQEAKSSATDGPSNVRVGILWCDNVLVLVSYNVAYHIL
jgi:hypothetical protein